MKPGSFIHRVGGQLYKVPFIYLSYICLFTCDKIHSKTCLVKEFMRGPQLGLYSCVVGFKVIRACKLVKMLVHNNSKQFECCFHSDIYFIQFICHIDLFFPCHFLFPPKLFCDS